MRDNPFVRADVARPPFSTTTKEKKHAKMVFIDKLLPVNACLHIAMNLLINIAKFREKIKKHTEVFDVTFPPPDEASIVLRQL